VRNRRFMFFAVALILFSAPHGLAQQKQLTIDDIYDPAKSVKFNGTTTTIRWLHDGRHYLLSSEPAQRDVSRLLKNRTHHRQGHAIYRCRENASCICCAGRYQRRGRVTVDESKFVHDEQRRVGGVD
jgi:hypothetical protein